MPQFSKEMNKKELSKAEWSQKVRKIYDSIRAKAPQMIRDLKELNDLGPEAVIVLAANPSREAIEIFPHFYYSEAGARGVDSVMEQGFLATHPLLVGLAFRSNGEEFELK